MADVLIRPARFIDGTVRLPGDKSISHRYAMLAALAQGESRLQNFSAGADCTSTVDCLRLLGVGCEQVGADLRVRGCGHRLHAPGSALDCGNSGSTIRMLSGILAAQNFSSELIGDRSVSQRPMERVVSPLQQMGADIVATGGHAPLKIKGSRLHGIHYQMPQASAQVKTSILFAGLLADGVTTVEEPARTRDHGELALRAFGAQVSFVGRKVSLAGHQTLHGLSALVPGDLSTAAFFLCAASLFPESNLTVSSVLLNPTRAVVLDLLAAMGALVTVTDLEDQHGELMGTVVLRGRTLRGAKVSSSTVPNLIDELPVVAAIAPYTAEGVEIRGAGELRFKESDRLAAVAANLKAMGAEFETFEDGLRIPGGQKLHGAELDSYGDHRIAMAFAVAALRAEGDTLIRDADVVKISCPDFFDTLDSVVHR